MAKNLVIVESPAKAKTIEGYLGKDFVVMSSYGHVRDLAKKGVAIDVENNFEPQYEISADKKKVIAELKKKVKEVDTVWLATDEDREGEAISWHLFEVLKLKNKDTKRITFNEITKDAVLKAITEPREIDKKLVDAQQARRILDRLVGFELSPVLWKKVKPSLSAGRVQSVAVRLLVEREREITNFKPSNYFRVVGDFKDGKSKISTVFSRNLDSQKEVEDILDKCKNADFTVTDVSKTPGTKNPSAPFTTSTLQQEASLKLGFNVSRTMMVAQSLYEAGHITYMRTDSVNLSDTAIQGAKAAIIKNYGAEYSKPRQYKGKSKGAQEAHEAIRPTNFSVSSISMGRDQERLYDLIWKRSIASQMAPAKLERTTIKISTPAIKEEFIARGEVIKFEGFLKVYLESKIEEEEEDQTIADILPDLKIGASVDVISIIARERFTKHPPRYVEASLVKKLEELGIGRPSTYAPTISTIQNRNYVIVGSLEGQPRELKTIKLKKGEIVEKIAVENFGADRRKLMPTDIGIVVNDFLVEYFEGILDYDFTAKVEESFDDIAEGKEKWTEMLDGFYKKFHSNVEKVEETAERATGERELGKDPKTGKPVFAKIGRYGPMIQIGEADDEEKPKFASLMKDQSIHNIELEEALKLFELPRQLGEYKDVLVEANVGRYGPYVMYGR